MKKSILITILSLIVVASVVCAVVFLPQLINNPPEETPTPSIAIETPTPDVPTPTPTPDIPTSSPDLPTPMPDVPTSSPDLPTPTPDVPTSSPDLPTPTPDAPTSSPDLPTPTPPVQCNHSNVETLPEVEPSCTEPGLTEGSRCLDCGLAIVEQKEVPALGHDTITVESVPPTCTQDGYTEKEYCSRCNETLLESTIIPALGHSPVVDQGYDPTETEEGLTNGSHCDRCGEILVPQEPIDKLEHIHEIVVVPAVAPTCSQTGTTELRYCSKCDFTEGGETLGKLPHQLEVIPAVLPDCEHDGTSEGKKCSICGEVTEAALPWPALGHEPVTDKGYAATTSQEGLSDGSHCGRCDKILQPQTTIPKLTHTHVPEIRGEFPATCQQDGFEGTTYCSICGELLDPGHAVPKTGHCWTNPYLSRATHMCMYCREKQPHNYRDEDSGIYIEHICDDCGYTYYEEKCKVHQYVFKEHHEATTCNEYLSNGASDDCRSYDIYECSVCTAWDFRNVKQKEHTMVVQSVTLRENTCQNEIYSTCSVCGDGKWEYEYNHDYVYDETITYCGCIYKYFACTRCGTTYCEETLLDDKCENHRDEWHLEVTFTPTQDKEGYSVYTCICGRTIDADYVPKIEKHTCDYEYYRWTDNGVRFESRTCKICGVKSRITYYPTSDDKYWGATGFNTDGTASSWGRLTYGDSENTTDYWCTPANFDYFDLRKDIPDECRPYLIFDFPEGFSIEALNSGKVTWQQLGSPRNYKVTAHIYWKTRDGQLQCFDWTSNVTDNGWFGGVTLYIPEDGTSIYMSGMGMIYYFDWTTHQQIN